MLRCWSLQHAVTAHCTNTLHQHTAPTHCKSTLQQHCNSTLHWYTAATEHPRQDATSAAATHSSIAATTLHQHTAATQCNNTLQQRIPITEHSHEDVRHRKLLRWCGKMLQCVVAVRGCSVSYATFAAVGRSILPKKMC